MIRTRFAPSPTGFAHIGNIRTALFAYLVAKHGDGKFILRLEDTDKNREVAGADTYIINAIKKLGLEYDEGPDIGGPFAPYQQSERLDHYKKWAEKLIAAGRAYPDPYTPEKVQAFREQSAKSGKPFRFRDYRPDNPKAWDDTQPLRFKSEPKDYKWHDEVMGDLSAGADAVDDFVLIKSDGYPTYNFAHIIDDVEMEISHIIRGQEFISSMPNYLNLYEALDIKPPIFAHVPHILNEIGNKKLGKRDGAKDALQYLNDGILVEALVNFIASMGWNDGTEQEVFSLSELINKFTLNRVGRSGARFDEKRLIWLNGQWIKRLSLDELTSRIENQGENSFWGKFGQKATPKQRREVLVVVQDRLKTLTDLPLLTEYFFTTPKPNWAMIDANKQLARLGRNELVKLLDVTVKKLENSDWTNEKIQNTLNKLLEETGTKPPQLFGIIRFALTWAPFSPGLPETMTLLGKNETISRLNEAIKNAN